MHRLLIIVIIALVSSTIKAQIQSDTSDAVWSIVKPEAQSINIDFKKVAVGEFKDSLIRSYITNTGSYKIRIDEISILGINSSLFRLVSGIPPFTIDPGKSKSVEFRFKPKEVGVKIANINIITQADTLHQIISGEGVLPILSIENNLIDFGKVNIYNFKDTLQAITIKNNSTKSINIKDVKISYPNIKDFSILSNAGSFIIAPGEIVKMDLRFKPSSRGRTSSTLLFEYDSPSSPAIVQLLGEGIQTNPKITTNAPICEWEDLLLFTEKMEDAAFHWYGPNGFTSDQQNPVIKRAKSFNSGKYCLYVTIDDMISDTVCIDVLVNSNLVSPGDSSLIFIGNASKQVDFIKLTEPKKWDGGSIWLKNRFSVKQNFSTTFKFRTKYGDDKGFKDGSLPGADGFAFVMQNHNYPSLGIKGGSLGYTGITNCLAIEYDLYQNYWDPNGNHIAVQSMGAGPNQPDHGNGSCLGINDKIVTIQQDTLYYSKIDYNWDSKTLKIYVDTNGKFETPSLSIPNIDLASYLNLEDGEYVYIGFTSGTGEAYQEHDLVDWVIPCKNQMVGVEENTFLTNKTDELYAYPNPANSQISISLNDEIKMNGNFYLYDFLGKLVTEGVINAGINVLNISTEMLQSGIYSLVVKFPNEVSRVKVIINK